MTLVMVAVFGVLLLLAFPVGYALVISSGAAVMTMGAVPTVIAVVKLFQPTQSFPLLAIPFFILSGALMMGGTLGRKLVAFAAALVGRYPGGLTQVTVVGSTIFGGVSGSAVAEASALGSMLIPWQKREGYPPAFGAAATASSSVIAGLIPPSIPLILFAAVSNASIASLFLAGIVPGLMLAAGFMLVCYVSGRLRHFPLLRSDGGLPGLLKATLTALPALLMPAFILVLLRFGIATPTEVSVVAVAYALVVSALIYRDLTVPRIYGALMATVVTTGVVMLVIAASNLVGYVLITEAIPNAVAEYAQTVLQERWLIILAMNLIMLVVGMFLDLPAAILLLGPTFVAVGGAIGLDPIQLGIMMAVNLSIGLFTPPIGTTLFISAAISREPIGAIVRELWPFYLVALTVLGLVSYVPAFILY
ncbi:TRAP transporter large permease [Azospirillum sp. RWY-5-1]|uniref:TRAP transporter large permease protein n=1 Tax=Azospirillum oleiclasticum TaxID=2735135 RepID=A0ABX2TAF1_9PROT|nr:TRAP transporter large permease [Azospirillum oleiclasticum]NYZ17688.1 TRAP transporter large permease [Azospirillum oleiclasticum]NYZ21166.1 TRAP transporter large permease [Azospirillum oleiclasticum]